MAEIGDAVGGQLGILAAEQVVERSDRVEDRAGQGKRQHIAAHRRTDRAGEIAMVPAVGGAIVGFDDLADQCVAGGQRQ